MGYIRKVSATRHVWWNGHHRFEHWYRDNTVYFLTSRVIGPASRQWKPLHEFAGDGMAPIDNNVGERETKWVLPSRKNSPFVGTVHGSATAVILASTCRRHGIDAQPCLTPLSTNLPITLPSKAGLICQNCGCRQFAVGYTHLRAGCTMRVRSCRSSTRRVMARERIADLLTGRIPATDSHGSGPLTQCCQYRLITL